MTLLLLLGVAFLVGSLIGGWAMLGIANWRQRRYVSGPFNRLVTSALAHLAVGDSKQAALVLQKAIEIRPEDDTLFLLLASTLVSNGENDRAARVLGTLLARREMSPDCRSAALRLSGRIAEAEGRVEAACEAYEDAAAVSVGGAGPLVELGRTLSKSGHWAEAIRSAERLTAIDPLRGKIVSARRRVLAAQEMLAEERPEDALEQAGKALEEQPEMPAALLTLGDAHFQLGQVRLAHEKWEAAAKRDPGLTALVIDRLEQPSENENRETPRRFALEAVEGTLGKGAWRVFAWLADDALRRGTFEACASWLTRWERSTSEGQASLARLQLRLTIQQDLPGAGPKARALAEKFAATDIWSEPWRCRRCGGPSSDFRWRCSHCSAWATLA